MTRRRLLGDDVLVRAAARRLAIRAAALVAVAMLLLVTLVTGVVVRGQASAADSLLRTTAATADDVGDPPPGAWLVFTRDGTTKASPGLPAEVAGRLVALRVRSSGTTRLTDVRVDDGRDYRVATVSRRAAVVQVVLDLTSEHAQRDRLLRAMGAAGVLALVVAAGLGALLGRRAVRPLAEALSLQRAFVADASHELRTPLTLLSTRSQVLHADLQAGRITPEVLSDAAGVVADVHRLGEVLEDLLVAADPRGQQPQHPVDVSRLARAVVESATAHAEAAGVTPAVEVASGATVLGNEPALRRAVLALVDNAIDHTPSGGTVTIRVRREGRDVVLIVSDTGPGVSPDAAAGLLRRFHSGGHRAGRPHYGLGLALTHDVANRHGGRLRLLPSPVGATFELRLPAAR